MFNIIKNSIDWNGKIIELETGKIARNASSSVTVRVDDTVLLCTVTFSKDLKESVDFFPLSVHYIEKHYDEINNDMNNRNSSTKSKKSKDKKIKTRKLREELSVSASKSIKKEEVQIVVSFK